MSRLEKTGLSLMICCGFFLVNNNSLFLDSPYIVFMFIGALMFSFGSKHD